MVYRNLKQPLTGTANKPFRASGNVEGPVVYASQSQSQHIGRCQHRDVSILSLLFEFGDPLIYSPWSHWTSCPFCFNVAVVSLFLWLAAADGVLLRVDPISCFGSECSPLAPCCNLAQAAVAASQLRNVLVRLSPGRPFVDRPDPQGPMRSTASARSTSSQSKQISRRARRSCPVHQTECSPSSPFPTQSPSPG